MVGLPCPVELYNVCCCRYTPGQEHRKRDPQSQAPVAPQHPGLPGGLYNRFTPVHSGALPLTILLPLQHNKLPASTGQVDADCLRPATCPIAALPGGVTAQNARKRDVCDVCQVEHASAGSLADRCEGRHMPETHARQLFGQLLDGLAYCHAQGIFHRDLRIAHVLLSGRCLPAQALGVGHMARDGFPFALVSTSMLSHAR